MAGLVLPVTCMMQGFAISSVGGISDSSFKILFQLPPARISTVWLVTGEA